jgi:hypothetical protein
MRLMAYLCVDTYIRSLGSQEAECVGAQVEDENKGLEMTAANIESVLDEIRCEWGGDGHGYLHGIAHACV